MKFEEINSAMKLIRKTVHPGKLKRNPKKNHGKVRFLFQRVIVRSHVLSPGGVDVLICFSCRLIHSSWSSGMEGRVNIDSFLSSGRSCHDMRKKVPIPVPFLKTTWKNAGGFNMELIGGNM